MAWLQGIELATVANNMAAALSVLDSQQPQDAARRYRPGVGPLPETELLARLLPILKASNPAVYAQAEPRLYPGSRRDCDLVIPGSWAIECKLARPYGDNGKPAERWSENLLYPYPGNTSCIGDCLKLLESRFTEGKAIIVFGYEHTPPKIPLEPALASFELIADQVVGIQLSPRIDLSIRGLVHPVHQQARILAWEILERRPRVA